MSNCPRDWVLAVLSSPVALSSEFVCECWSCNFWTIPVKMSFYFQFRDKAYSKEICSMNSSWNKYKRSFIYLFRELRVGALFTDAVWFKNSSFSTGPSEEHSEDCSSIWQLLQCLRNTILTSMWCTPAALCMPLKPHKQRWDFLGEAHEKGQTQILTQSQQLIKYQRNWAERPSAEICY